jgi:hypothetical protein
MDVNIYIYIYCFHKFACGIDYSRGLNDALLDYIKNDLLVYVFDNQLYSFLFFLYALHFLIVFYLLFVCFVLLCFVFFCFLLFCSVSTMHSLYFMHAVNKKDNNSNYPSFICILSFLSFYILLIYIYICLFVFV